jgi:hypothetical protein
MGYIPKVILTDGDKCYPDAIKEVFKNANDNFGEYQFI